MVLFDVSMWIEVWKVGLRKKTEKADSIWQKGKKMFEKIDKKLDLFKSIENKLEVVAKITH